MRVVLSASACAPDRGSEPGTGWQWATAAASRHEVWLLTPERNRDAIESERSGRPDLAGLTPVYVPEPSWIPTDASALRFRRARYLFWQREVGVMARELHRTARFDVAHHVTFASDWQPCGLARLDDLPLVWGPVGGATRSAWPLWRELGPRGLAEEAVREVVTGTARRAIGRRVARRAAVTVAMNPDVAAAFGSVADVVVEPNVAIDPAVLDHPSPPTGPTDRYCTAVFAGRLIGWKGARLAIEALARPEAADWRLELLGEGPREGDLRRLADGLGLADRVEFRGYRPRDEVLDTLARADAFVFPSLHDSAGWAVAEAITLGCPVVCLDRGGPALLAGEVGDQVVPVTASVVADLATALDRVRPRGDRSPRWTADRLPDVIDDLYRRAVAHHDRGRVGKGASAAAAPAGPIGGAGPSARPTTTEPMP